MYAGHFAAAYAIKAREPKVPTWALLVGVVALDIVFPSFVLTGTKLISFTLFCTFCRPPCTIFELILNGFAAFG